MRVCSFACVLFMGMFGPAFSQQTAGCWLVGATAPDESTTYLLCESGLVLVSRNSGRWDVIRVPAAGRSRAIQFVDSNRGYVAGDSGLVVTTADGGATWNRLDTGIREDLTDVQAVGRNLWAAGLSGTILHSADAGRSWQRQPTFTTRTIESIHFIDESRGWAAGWSGLLLRTTDGGGSWQQVDGPDVRDTLSSIHFRDARNGWAVGMSGAILRSRDGGATWQRQPAPVNAWLTSVDFSLDGTGWIAAEYTLLRSDDGGETWHAVPLETDMAVTRVRATHKSVLAVGPGSLLTHSSEDKLLRIDAHEILRQDDRLQDAHARDSIPE